MNTDLLQPLNIGDEQQDPTRFSVCTIVNNHAEYANMIESFACHGFSPEQTQFLFVDNSRGNRFDAYQAINKLLLRAIGQYIILCHQDVILLEDKTKLLTIIADIENRDNQWAAIGNAGARPDGRQVLRITDPTSTNASIGGPFPVEVHSLDENFIVVRRDANLALSHDLHGFHFYGLDLCIIANILGLRCYVADFHIHHKSAGTIDCGYYALRTAITQKYKRAFQSRGIYTSTHRSVPISGSSAYITIFKALRRLKNLAWHRD